MDESRVNSPPVRRLGHLAMSFPQYAVSKWIGHSITVSGRHYANDVPMELFAKAAKIDIQAAQNQAQNATDLTETTSSPKNEKPGFSGHFCDSASPVFWGDGI
jgi:hypothetical protein